MRPMRVADGRRALLRALCGQLIQSSRARDLERTIVRATSGRSAGYATPPTAASLAALSPADLRRLGLHARRGATLVRLCRSLDLERAERVPVDAVAARLLRERGLGPWSVGVIALEGLGSYERGLVGDLGLLKLCRRSAAGGSRRGDGGAARAVRGVGGPRERLPARGFARGLFPLPDARAA